MSNKCSNCGGEIEKTGFFLCKDCYYNFTYHYYRVLAYNTSENKSIVYDFLYDYSSDLSADKELSQYINTEKHYVLTMQRLPEDFNEGSLKLLSLKDFEECKVAKRTTFDGYPKTYLFKCGMYEAIRVQLGDEYYFLSAGEYGIDFPTEELAESFEEIEDYITEEVPNTEYKKCLLCDNKVYNEEYSLCSDCFYKYKDKKLLIELEPKNNSIQLLDASYEGRFVCEDGHVVKSQAERAIDNYLFSHNIKHGYEVSLPIEYDNGEKIELHPDFCIFKGDEKVYIEYWGMENDPYYEEMKKSKLDLYKKEGITLINMYKKTDLKNITSLLEYKLSKYRKGQINFEE